MIKDEGKTTNRRLSQNVMQQANIAGGHLTFETNSMLPFQLRCLWSVKGNIFWNNLTTFSTKPLSNKHFKIKYLC
jgi:hypothetical protein